MASSTVKELDRIAVAIALPVILVLFPFLHVYANNVTNLQLPMAAFFPQIAPLVLGLTVVSYLLLKLLPLTIERLLIAVAVFLMVLAWLQTNFFIGSYGFLTGETPDWTEDRISQVLQSLLLLTVGLLVVWFRRLVSENAAFIVALMILSSSAYIPALLETSKKIDDKKYTFNKNGIFEFSTQKNVVIIVLDSAQADVVHEVLTEKPAIAEKYRGFTLFRNSLSPFPKTYASIPALLSGDAYDNSLPLHDYLETTYLEKSLPAKLTEQGFDSRLLSSSPISLLAHPKLAANVSDVGGVNAADGTVLVNETELIANLMLFRVSPHLMKSFIYNDGDFRIELGAEQPEQLNNPDNQSVLCTITDEDRDYSKERKTFDYTFIDEFRVCANASLSKPALRFFHLYAPHAPYQTDESFRYIGSQPLSRLWFKRQTEGILGALGDLLQLMETRGILQNSLVIITSDHGEGEYDVGINYPDGLPERSAQESQIGLNLVRGGMALMMAKRPADNGALKISDAPVGLTDVPSTVYDWLDMEDRTTGRSLFDVAEGEPRSRIHRYYQFAGWNIDYIVPLTEYKVDGFSWYPSSWSLSEKTFDENMVASFDGEFLTLHRGGNFDDRTHSGWTTPGKIARGVTESGATVQLAGSGVSLLTAKHALYRGEDTAIEVFADEKPIGAWNFSKNDGQRTKTAVLEAEGEFELSFRTESATGRAVRFRELRLESVDKYAYDLGTAIDFTDTGNSDAFRTYGWSRTEVWGTSSIGHASGLMLYLGESINAPLKLSLLLSGYVFDPSPSREIDVYANEVLIGTLTVTSRRNLTHDFIIQPDVFAQTHALDISLRHRNPIRQRDLGVSGDTRLQSIAMVELKVAALSEPDDASGD